MCLYRQPPPSRTETPLGSAQKEPRNDVLAELPVAEVTKAAVSTQSGEQSSEVAMSHTSDPVQSMAAPIIEEPRETTVELGGNPPAAAAGYIMTPVEIEETPV